jgi:hypothetical protein
MSLYNVKREVNGEFRVTKFTDDLEIDETAGKPASYLTTEFGCDCPAGHRPSCRHREMLPDFVSTHRVDTAWMLDHDNQRWFYYDVENGRMLDHEPTPRKRVKSWRRF